MKLLKILIITLLAIVLLAGAAVAAVYFLVDPNDYREDISSKVTEQTGRDFQLQGDINLSLFPWLGLELGSMQLGNAEGFGDKPMMRVERAEARVKLMPLFSQQVEVDVVTLEGVDLNLARDKQGRSNWDDLVERFSSDAASEAPEETTDAGSLAFSLHGFQLVNTRLHWQDASTGDNYVLRDVNLAMGAFADAQTFPLELSGTLDSAEPKASISVAMNADVNAGLESQVFSAKGLEMTVIAKGADIPAGEQKMVLSGDAVANLLTGKAELTELLLKAANAELKGQLNAANILEAPTFTGQLSSNRFSLRELMQKMGIEAPVTADAEVLKVFEFSANLDGSTEQMRLTKVKLTLDDSQFSGDMSVKDFSKPQLSFKLSGDKLNADRYMAPTAEGVSDKPAAEQTAEERAAARKAEDETPLDLAWIRDLNLNGQLQLGELIMSAMKFTDITTQVRSRDGVLTLDPATLRLYGGGLRMTSTVDVRGSKPKIRVENMLTGVQAGPLQKDLLEKIFLNGRSDLQMNLSTSGATVGDLRKALDGTISFSFKDGAVNGFNLAETLRKARALYKKEPMTQVAGNRETDFAELTGTINILNGIARGEDLLASSPAFRLTGSGVIDLIAERLDYTAVPKLVETSKGQGAGDLDDLKGVAIPVRCKGSLFDPKCRIDIEDALKARVKDEARKRVSEEVEKRAPELFQKLPGLFGR